MPIRKPLKEDLSMAAKASVQLIGNISILPTTRIETGQKAHGCNG